METKESPKNVLGADIVAKVTLVSHTIDEDHDAFSGVKVFFSDLSQIGRVKQHFSTDRPDIVFYIASHYAPSIALDPTNEEPGGALLVSNEQALGPLRILESMRAAGIDKHPLVQVVDGEIYGEIPASGAIDEKVQFKPAQASVSAVSKHTGWWFAINYREAYKMKVSNVVTLPHQSPLGITMPGLHHGALDLGSHLAEAVARVSKGVDQCAKIGELDKKCDWAHTKDFAEALCLEAERLAGGAEGDNLVFSAGQSRTVREFVTAAFATLNLNIKWSGKGNEEVATDQHKRVVVRADPNFPNDFALYLYGNPAKAQALLKWKPQISFEALVKELMEVALTQKWKAAC